MYYTCIQCRVFQARNWTWLTCKWPFRNGNQGLDNGQKMRIGWLSLSDNTGTFFDSFDWQFLKIMSYRSEIIPWIKKRTQVRRLVLVSVTILPLIWSNWFVYMFKWSRKVNVGLSALMAFNSVKIESWISKILNCGNWITAIWNWILSMNKKKKRKTIKKICDRFLLSRKMI